MVSPEPERNKNTRLAAAPGVRTADFGTTEKNPLVL